MGKGLGYLAAQRSQPAKHHNMVFTLVCFGDDEITMNHMILKQE